MHRIGRASLVAFTLAFCVSLAAAAPAQGGDVLRGICDPGLLQSWWQDGPAVVDEFSGDLDADVVRINLDWRRAEPSPGVYDDDYLARTGEAVALIRARGRAGHRRRVIHTRLGIRSRPVGERAAR